VRGDTVVPREEREMADVEGDAMESQAKIRIATVATAIDERSATDAVHEQTSISSAKMETRSLSVSYGSFVAVRDISLEFPENRITAIIGPSGSGKSTLLRALNRMHDALPSARIHGDVLLDGQPIYGPNVDPVEVRRKIGMVFQRPNPFAKSIFDNVAYGLKHAGDGRMSKSALNEAVEHALRRAALWDEVKDRLNRSALSLSGGQQQRLCVARAIAVDPEVILMDEPASALDPIATLRIEDLMKELIERYTIIIVTHNMQQAARVSDVTVFMTMGEGRAGELVEVGPTREIFTSPHDKRTEDYITGRVG
jgi:phosphate transport system ATP-binding protein